MGPKAMKEYIIPDVAHKAVFTNVLIIGLQNSRSYKDQLGQTVLSKVDVEGRYKSCGWEGDGWRNVIVSYVNQ